MTQVITITPEGGMSGLQRKPNKGVDLRAFGHAAIERVSEIVWNEPAQRWQIHVISGPQAGRMLTYTDWHDIFDRPYPVGYNCPEGVDWEGQLSFTDYDEAVAAEVKYLDALRVRGTF